jgi:4-hydroxy-2-oxoheptanedioate aldolase
MSATPKLIRANLFKERAAKGECPRALWITIPWGPILDMAGSAGIDAALIDLEHTTMSMQQAENLIVSAEAANVTPMVRPPSADPSVVTPLLDAGAMGVVFPKIETVEQAVQATRVVRYPPAGTRGWGGSHVRAARWTGASAPLALSSGSEPYTRRYVDEADLSIACIYLVETPGGVESLPKILDAARADGVLFGWGDYSVETGFDAERCEEAAQAVYDVCRASDVGCGVALSESARRPAFTGCFEVIGVDSVMLAGAIQARATRH